MKSFRRSMLAVALSAAIFLIASQAMAGVPIFNIEGEGGGGLITWAYLTNPPKDGAMIGKPSVGATYIFPTNFQLSIYHLNETITDRLELGYTRSVFDTSSLIGGAAGFTDTFTFDFGINEITMDIWHAKILLLKEGQFSDLMPAVSLSVEYKNNKDVDTINDRTGGLLTAAGMDDNSGVDYILAVTKLFKDTFLGMPILVNASTRYTKGAQTGYLGFSKDANFTGEFTLAVLPESNVAVGAEFRTKPDEYTDVAGVGSFDESNWGDFFIAYFPTPGLSVSAAIVNFGNIVNRNVNSGLWMNMKYDF
jgi:hypothetical protein